MTVDWPRVRLVGGLVALGVAIGVLLTWVGHAGVKATSGAAFCGSCHVMQPMVESNRADVHGGAGALGAPAECVDCHLPHSTLVGYLYQKGVDGVRDVWVNTFGDPMAIDWHARRDARARYVYDSGCLACHATVVEASAGLAGEMHALYAGRRGAEEPLQCVSCHVSVGHRGLGARIEAMHGEPDYGEW